MPGSIKVSGTQRTIAAPYVKVAGTWRPAAVGYVKVAGTWRQWYASSIIDNFNRADSTPLGTTSNGVTSWTSTSGTWSVASNQATSSTSVSSYPIATVSNPLGTSNYELGIDIPTGAGQGVAFWVTDSANWWAVVTDIVTTNNYSCPSGGVVSGSDCVVTSTYNAYSSSYNCGQYYSYDCSYDATPTPAGYIYQGSFCTGCTGTGGNGGTLSCTSINGKFGCWEIIPAGYTCPNGGTLSGNRCIKTCTGCTTGGSDSCYSCTSYSCNSGDSLSGSTCTHTSTYSATNSPTYTYSTNIVKSVAGVVSTVVSYTHSAAVRSLKVTTSNNSVTVAAYASSGQTSQLNSNVYTATSPATTAVAGMVLSPASSSQGLTLDNFYLK